MYITINGQLGSGKSEVCRILNKEFGYEVFSTGRIQRAYANELGISTLELNKLCAVNPSYDFIIDDRLVQYAENNRDKNIIFDSRMAWHFVKNAFKVHLLVSPMIAAQRVYQNRQTVEERYLTVEDAMRDLQSRLGMENERYFQLYNVIPSNYENYDVIIDTSDISPEKVVAILIDSLKKFENKQAYSNLFVSPKNVFPTEYPDIFDDASDVFLEKRGTELFILKGHAKIMEALKNKIDVIPACLENQNPTAQSLSLEILEKWEKKGNFKYSYYPLSYKK